MAFLFTFNNVLISSARILPSAVATATAQGEYGAAEVATEKARWIRRLFSELGINGGAVSNGEDNQACLAVVNIHNTTGCTKKLDVAYRMVRDCGSRADVAVYFFFLVRKCPRTG